MYEEHVRYIVTTLFIQEYESRVQNVTYRFARGKESQSMNCKLSQKLGPIRVKCNFGKACLGKPAFTITQFLQYIEMQQKR